MKPSLSLKNFKRIITLLLLVCTFILVLGLIRTKSPITPSTPNISQLSISGGQSTPDQIPKSNRYWILTASTLNQLVVNPSARQALVNDTLLVPNSKTDQLVSEAKGLNIYPVASFTSEAALAKAVTGGLIAAGTKFLLYDNEDWSLTPLNEQSDPASYYQAATSLAHSHNYFLIGTPVSKTDPSVDVQIAPYVDVLDIQSQYDQAPVSAYAAHVLPIAQAAKKANPDLIILSGLSTNPSAGIPTPEELLSDTQAVDGVVQGYWLNVPSPGTACPKCRLPEPQIGIEFLSALGSD